jgi:tetratricopeptide (TPR) repeat protein
MDEFAGLFRTYVANSARAALSTISADGSILPDEVRIRALHVLSFALEWDAAWSAVRDLLLRMAPKMEQAGFRDEWLAYLESGVQQSQRCADRRAEAELRLYIGELHRLRSRFDQARHWLTTSVDIFAALNAPQGQARALNELAFLDWQQHRYAEAAQLAHAALQLLNDDDPERATSFTRLGLIAFDRQRWQEAEGYQRAALQIRTTQGDQRKMAWSLQNLGLALRDQGKYGDAIACYEEAITILEEIRDTANCANAQVNLGIVYYLDGQTTKALEVYKRTENTYRKIFDTHNLAKILLNQGLAYLALHDWIGAESSFSVSIALFQNIGDLSWRLNASDGLGLVYLDWGQYDKAVAVFEKALTELPQISGTPMHEYLAGVLPEHLEQAKQKRGIA